jgi:hypothetical protein
MCNTKVCTEVEGEEMAYLLGNMTEATTFAPEVTAEPCPEYALYDAGSVRVAAIFGGPLAGTSVMAINYNRHGERGKAFAALAWGIALTGLSVVPGYFITIPSGAQTGIAVAMAMAIGGYAQSSQGGMIEKHRELGGRIASRWAAFGIGLIFLGLVLGTIFGTAAFIENRAKVMVGSNHTVFYTGTASRQEAESLGTALKNVGYFEDRASTVVLDKGADGTTLSLVATDGAWENPHYIIAFDQTALDVAPSIGGAATAFKVARHERESDAGRDGGAGDLQLRSEHRLLRDGDRSQG